MVGNKCKSSNSYTNNTNSCKQDLNMQWNGYTFSFMFWPYGANVVKVCFQSFSLWRGLVGSFLPISAIKTSLRKPLCSLSQKCSHRCSCMQDVPCACLRELDLWLFHLQRKVSTVWPIYCFLPLLQVRR